MASHKINSSSSTAILISKEDLCINCQTIDLELAFKIPVYDPTLPSEWRHDGFVIQDLGFSLPEMRASSCALCRLLASLAGDGEEMRGVDEASKSGYMTPSLTSFSAREEMTMGEQDDDEEEKSLREEDSGEEWGERSDNLNVVIGEDELDARDGEDVDKVKGDAATGGIEQPPGWQDTRLLGWTVGDGDYTSYRSGMFLHLVNSASTSDFQPFQFRPLNHDCYDIEFARQCISNCHINHGPSCQQPEKELLPGFKVIDCKTRQLIIAPSPCQYVALSYVWGPPPPESSNPKTSLDAEGYPRLIDHSIQVTLDLGLQYIWIDRYCINQENEEERMSHIKQMDKIYADAEITIIAAAGQGPDYGLPGVGKLSRKQQARLQIENLELISTLPNTKAVVTASKWASRAWTYQEGILSKRRLIFTDDQITFQCNTTHLPEVMPPSSMASIRNIGLYMDGGTFTNELAGTTPGSIMAYISDYTSRDLTFHEDKLNAMQGIFRAFERAEVKVLNFMGVAIHPARDQDRTSATPQRAFVRGLAWYHHIPTKQVQRRSIFPSWTWAGWEGKIEPEIFQPVFTDPPYAPKVWIENLDETHVPFPDYSSLPGFLKSLSGSDKYIHIEASTFSCSLVYIPATTEDISSSGGKPEIHITTTSNHIIIPSIVATHARLQWEESESCLPAREMMGLLLGEKVAMIVMRMEGGWFERVVLCHFDFSSSVRVAGDGQGDETGGGFMFVPDAYKRIEEVIEKFLTEETSIKKIKLG
ncbi:uncharacterized protein PAC_04852 [Phialocephala subalpina]|uniref:Heterokaryon incompatibility domain-containing protein n=1 Tax=Phialocephala subalpina TaxID=576137 RepID=A0A1L7WQD6_9HELO|nr:uncharacterized protein PAC_04852 [Phialocephala subalpina]